MAEEQIAKRVHACCTCTFWGRAERKPSEDKAFVEFQSFQKGICMGAGSPYNLQPTTPLNRCPRWRMWLKLM